MEEEPGGRRYEAVQTGCSCPLFSSVYLIYVKRSARSVAYVATLAELRIGVGLRVRQGRLLEVARRASRRGCRNRVQQTLRIGHQVLADREVCFRAVRMAHVALRR